VTLSDEGGYGIAVVVLEKGPPDEPLQSVTK
jgi:hypothetical protein